MRAVFIMYIECMAVKMAASFSKLWLVISLSLFLVYNIHELFPLNVFNSGHCNTQTNTDFALVVVFAFEKLPFLMWLVYIMRFRVALFLISIHSLIKTIFNWFYFHVFSPFFSSPMCVYLFFFAICFFV